MTCSKWGGTATSLVVTLSVYGFTTVTAVVDDERRYRVLDASKSKRGMQTRYGPEKKGRGGKVKRW